MNALSRPAPLVLSAILMATMTLTSTPAAAQAQSSPSPFTPRLTNPGFYVGVEGGLNWLLNSDNFNFDTGYAVGGVVGYDFTGPRFELEGVFRGNNGSGFRGPFGTNGTFDQLTFMVNGLYDFLPGATLTPYVGAGIGLAFVDSGPGGCSLCNTEFAYQAIVGMSWRVERRVRVNLDARYHGTTSGDLPYQNNDISTMLSVSYRLD